jgi:hypothetical protein
MNIKEFAYLQKSKKKEADTVDLVCDSCGEKVTRPVFVRLTGHLHDQKCTYICTVCRGAMREEVDPINQDEEK